MKKVVGFIAAVIVVVIILLLTCTKKQEEPAEPDAGSSVEKGSIETEKQEDAEPVQLTEEELQGPVGRLNVEALRNFPVFVTDSDGRKIALGHCNKEWKLPPGEYTVSVKPEQFPEMEVGAVTITENETSNLTAGGFGHVNVKAMALFHGGPRLVTEAGEEIPLGHCNKEWLVPVGTYTLTFKTDRSEEKNLGSITVKEGETTEAEMTGFGWVNVKASEDFWNVVLETAEGKIIKVDHCNKKWIVPVGTYTVKVKDKSLKNIKINEADVTEVEIGL